MMDKQTNTTNAPVVQNVVKKLLSENNKPTTGKKSLPVSSNESRSPSPSSKVTSPVQRRSPPLATVAKPPPALPSRTASPSTVPQKPSISPFPSLSSSSKSPSSPSTATTTFPKSLLPSTASPRPSVRSTSIFRPPSSSPCRPAPTSPQRPVPRPVNQFAQRLALAKTPEVVPEEELRQLTSRFQKLSGTILELAASDCPVSARSLESLLSREVEGCLGPAVNSAKFAKAFAQETRRLLESLNWEFEEGRVNPSLLRDNKSLLRADSATTVCYRDRYLKELVMSALQSMSCARPEVEKEARPRSEASRLRISALRDLVRAEAGLEPEAFRRGEESLRLLSERLERGREEVTTTVREVDKLISEQRGRPLDMDIPQSAKDALRGGKEVTKAEEESRCSTNCCEISSRNCAENGGKCQEEVVLLEKKSDKGKGEGKNVSSAETSDEGSSGGPEEASVTSDSGLCDSDDETSLEETILFLGAYSKDLEKSRSLAMKTLGYTTSLEKVEEGCEDGGEEENARTHGQGGENFRGSLQKKGLPSSDDGESVTLQNEDVSCDVEEIGQHVLHRVKSRCWWPSNDDSEAAKVIAEMKTAFEDFGNFMKISEEIFTNKDKENENDRDNHEKGSYDFTIEEMAHILMKISSKVQELPIYLDKDGAECFESRYPLSHSQQDQLIQVFTGLEYFIDSSSLQNNDLKSCFDYNENPLSINTKKVSQTFSRLSDVLNCVPTRLKSQPVSILIPPESLTRTLAVLASTGYFKECFISAIMEVSKKKSEMTSFDDVLSKMSSHVFQASVEESEGSHDIRPDFEELKPVGMVDQSSSEEITTTEPYDPLESWSIWKLRAFEMNADKSAGWEENLRKYEHYLGMSSSVLTVQDVSNMFLYMATALNDVPDRIKSKRLSSLNPPLTLTMALRMLARVDERTSLASLTVQHASDIFLTLSKRFLDLPERMRRASLLELEPPKSLLHAVTLLTSLQLNADHEDVKEADDQEHFYDACDSVASS